MAALSPDDVISPLRAALLAFYDQHKRDLPWRRTRDPYAIWVSEIMLQQTQVDVVRPRWQAFLHRFPDVRALARASEEQVCEAWAGLGYYRRARHLHKAARVLVQEHDAIFPRTARELEKLPGIGRYTSGAIASIAFGEEAAIVDGNVARVLARIFTIDAAFDTGPGQRLTWSLAASLALGERPGDFNQALMELGATVCTPRSPKCLLCPARALCQAHARGDEAAYPRATKRATVKAMPMSFAILRDVNGTLLRQRPLDGLWAGLWEPPSVEGSGKQLAALLGVAVGKPVVRVSHQLSHRDITASVYIVEVPSALTGLTSWPDPFAAPLSGLAKKVLQSVKNHASPRG